MATDHPILFFDGVCNLCSGAVQWYIERDTEGNLRFASLQSDLAAELLPAAGVQPAGLSSLVFLTGGKAYTKSTGALRAARHLDGYWPAVSKVLTLFPAWLRDGVYDFIARNRYRWFGKHESCWLPTPELKARFIG